MKFGFVTCVELGLSCMEAIYHAGGELDLVITLPDDKARKKSGRVYVDSFCDEHNIPLIKSSNVNNDDVIQAIQEHGIDWLFIIGWSQIAKIAVLSAPSRGVLGMHPTLLPIGRGRAAIPWAILKSLEKTGVTMFQLDSGVDTGPIFKQLEIPIACNETATTLYQRVNEAHYELMTMAIPLLIEDKLPLVAQEPGSATVWPGRTPEDGLIDLSGSVHDAERLVRATTKPYPGAYFMDEQNRKIIVWSAQLVEQIGESDAILQFSDGILKLLHVEPDS